ARNAKGLLDATSQWTALQDEVQNHQFPLSEMPPPVTGSKDIFVAFEFEVDEQNNYSKVARIYRDSEVRKAVRGDTQLLLVRRSGEQSAREIRVFGRQGLSGQLQ